LAFDLFGIKKYWHKRIVRSGANTLFPYDENPKNLLVKEDDILFIDFGPIFEEWEADYGRTYVIGQDPLKQRLVRDIEKAWHDANKFYHSQKDISGKKLYSYCCNLAKEMGWEFGGSIAGHLIGHFPHEKLEKEDKTNYIHPKNLINMNAPDRNGNVRHWILEIHFVDRKLKIGGFFEQLLIKK
jgi:Xaa-Pro aminopeptidase